MNTILRLAAPFALSTAALLNACRSNDQAGARTAGDSATGGAATARSLEGPRRTDSTPSGMQGMQGSQMSGMMGSGMTSGGMMDSMQTQMRMMQGMSPDQMKAMLPAHRQMVANMLSQLNGDMRKMNMRPDARWTVLTDSVRRDLASMPEMSASELRSSMPAHSARMMRLVEMHRSIMGGMKR